MDAGAFYCLLSSIAGGRDGVRHAIVPLWRGDCGFGGLTRRQREASGLPPDGRRMGVWE